MPVPITVILSDALTLELTSRGPSPSAILERDLRRYYANLSHARARLREAFIPKELAAILDTLNGQWFHDPSSAQSIYAEVEDNIRLNGLDEKWQISGPALLHTLRGLSFIESIALADAAERWWTRVSRGEHTLSPEDALAEDPHV